MFIYCLQCFDTICFVSKLAKADRKFPVKVFWETGLTHCEDKIADKKLSNPPQRCIEEPLMVRDRDGRPQEDHLAVCVAGVYCWMISLG